MNDILIFLIAAGASLLDPIAIAGYVVAGIFLRSLWAAALGGAVWALAMQAFIMVMMAQEPGTWRFGHEFDWFPARLFAGVAAACAVCLFARLVRAGNAQLPAEEPPADLT